MQQLVNIHVQQALAERQSRVEHLHEQLRHEEEAAAALTSENAALRQQLAPVLAPEVRRILQILLQCLQVLTSQPVSQWQEAVPGMRCAACVARL